VAVSGSVAPGPPSLQTFTVYGRIPARQSGAHVGDYTDVITAILNY
jgi:spore coat protein U-like protein